MHVAYLDCLLLSIILCAVSITMIATIEVIKR